MVKRRRKEEGKRRKREEKEGKNMGTKSQKKKKEKKKEVCAHLFPLRSSSFFGSIRNMLFREKHTISTFIFMQDFLDEQIM